MIQSVKDDNLRLLHAETETAFIERKLARSAVTTTIGVVLGIVLFVALSHITRWSIDLAWLIPISMAPLGLTLFGIIGFRRYRAMQMEHRAFLKKYNRL